LMISAMIQIKQYPRTIADSVRRKDDRRKTKRAELKRRKELERQQKLEEIKRLKNLKKKEINDKLKRLRTVAGDEHLAVNLDDLDEDFDPKEYDRRMQVNEISVQIADLFIFYFV
jgi:protein KRI1